MKASRVLIIGLDGATFDIMKPWIQAGYLPTMARLMDQGVHGPLLAWPNMNSAAAWTSMVTGCNPGQHGVFDFGTAAPQQGTTWRPTTARSRAKFPFWHFLSAAKGRVGIVNIPITYPADSVNGFMLAGMDAPSVKSPGFAHPPGLLEELRRAGINYVLDAPKLEDSGKRNPFQTPDLVRRMIEGRAGAILHLMKSHTWDALMAVFIATDRIQHFYWPGGDVSFDSPGWGPVRSVYEQIDSFLDEALKLAGERTTVLLVSDHGFGPAHYATRSLNQLLGQLGLVSYHQGGSRFSSRLFKNLLHYGRKIIPLSLQPHLARAFPKVHLRSLSESAFYGIDWPSTKAYIHPYGGEVYVNLKGREVEGIVTPEEYDSIRERVREILLNLTDATTGKRLVRSVERREELYHGPYFQEAADLTILWDYDIVRDSLCYHANGERAIVQAQKRSGSAKEWRGTHRPEGIFIAHGPHIKRGSAVTNATLYDIAPTILYLQHHPVPEDMDGKVLTDIFTPERLSRYPIEYCQPADIVDKHAQADLDAKETEQIKERLKDLGYLE